MKINDIKKQIETCQEAKKDLMKAVEPFMAYWKVVQDFKKQIAIISQQERYLNKQLEKAYELSTKKVDNEEEEE